EGRIATLSLVAGRRRSRKPRAPVPSLANKTSQARPRATSHSFAQRFATTHLSSCEHLSVVSVPVALKNLTRVVFSFETEQFSKIRIARFNLIARGIFMVGQIV